MFCGRALAPPAGEPFDRFDHAIGDREVNRLAEPRLDSFGEPIPQIDDHVEYVPDKNTHVLGDGLCDVFRDQALPELDGGSNGLLQAVDRAPRERVGAPAEEECDILDEKSEDRRESRDDGELGDHEQKPGVDQGDRRGP